MLSDHCLSVLSCLSVCDVGVLWPNGWMDQDETWHADRPQPWPRCVRWGPSSPSQRGTALSPIFGPRLLWPNCWMDQDATWYGGGPRPRRHCVRWDPTSPTQKGGTATNQFSAHVYCGQTAVCIRIPFGAEAGLSLGDIVLDGDSAPLP